MKLIFDFDSSREYLSHRLEVMPNGGYGQMSRLAEHMNVHSSLVSQIFSGRKSLTIDMAAQVAQYFALGPLETDYFLALVQHERAGTQVLRGAMRRSLDALKSRAADVRQTIVVERALSEQERAVFYSSWTYAAFRQLCAIGRGMDVPSLARILDLPQSAVLHVAEFLVSTGLCIKDGTKYRVGPSSTYIERSSPWARVHHRNWRDRALVAMDYERDADLFYTSPVSLSRADAHHVRRAIADLIQRVNAIVDPSSSEVARCLSIDWFQPALREPQ